MAPSLDTRSAALIGSMLVLGISHGLGPDHCLAVAALSVRQGRAAAVKAALRFGLGHSLVLFAFAALLRSVGGTLSPSFERAGEIANGTLLLLFGIGLFLDRLSPVLGSHSHSHQAHDHGHVHAAPGHGDALRRSGHGAVAVGGLFALSGIRSAALAVPLAFEGRPLPALLGLFAFGVGVVASMVAYGVALALLQRAMGSTGVTERGMRRMLGATSAAFGCYWLAIA